MRLWTALICTVIALQSMVVRGETWSCSYTYYDESRVFVRQRVDGGFTDPTSDHLVVYTVLNEDDSAIHLYSSYFGNLNNYYATLLNKENKTFSGIYLGTERNSALISGPCEIY